MSLPEQTPFPRATSARVAAADVASAPPALERDDEPDTVGERELHQLSALLSRSTSTLGGLPIALRVELGGALHALERHLAKRGAGGGQTV